MVQNFDVVIIGAGGAGLRAAVEIPKEYSCAVLSKVFVHVHTQVQPREVFAQRLQIWKMTRGKTMHTIR